MLIALLIIFAAWFYRPWSPYSPARVVFDREKADRTESFRTMDEIFPHQTIHGAEYVYDFPRSELPVLDLTYEYDGETRNVADFVDRAWITGLVVIKDGVLVHESYHRGSERETRHTSWSVAKSYVSTLIGMALKDGRITSLDDRTDKYAPEFEGTDYGPVTLRQLLMMSSGIEFNENYEERGSDIRNLFFNTFLLNRDVDKQVAKYKSSRAPETDFDYISPNTHVLSVVIRNVFDMPVGQAADERIFKPLGMAEASWSTDRHAKDAKAIGYCCINTRVVDYAKFGQLYLQDGVWNGERLLPEGWVDLIRTPQTPNHEPGPAGSGKRGYGLHFWLPSGADNEFSANGFNGQIIWMDKKRDVVIMRTAADRDFFSRANENEAVLRAIAKAVSGE